MATLLEGDAPALSAVASPSTSTGLDRVERGARTGPGDGTDGDAPAPGLTRLQKAQLAATWRASGLTVREIAKVLGISRSYASSLLLDPDGSKDRERKKKYAQPCENCGTLTNGSDGRKQHPLCGNCGHEHAAAVSRAVNTVWTAELIISRIQEWAELYGQPPAQADWCPTFCYRLNDPDRAQPYLDAGGYWPPHTVVYRRLPSWSAAIAAAGFTPRNPTGKGNPNRKQRRERP